MGKGLQCPPSAKVCTVLTLKLNIGIAAGGSGGLAVGVSLRRLDMLAISNDQELAYLV